MQDSAEVAAMVSTNQTRVHSPVTSVVWARQHAHPKPCPVRNVVTNATRECNWPLTVNVNPVREALTELRASKHPARLVHWDELHLKSVLPQLKNVRYPFVRQERI